MSERSFSHIHENPMAGDVIEIREGEGDDSTEKMLRVLAVIEEWVWLKEYGCGGRPAITVKAWRARLSNASVGKVVRPGDQDCPF